MKAGIGRALGVVNTLENWLIAALALALRLLAGVQSVVRLPDYGVYRREPLSSVGVNWVARHGSVTVARSEKQISAHMVGR